MMSRDQTRQDAIKTIVDVVESTTSVLLEASHICIEDMMYVVQRDEG
jgi:hypothetical protein